MYAHIKIAYRGGGSKMAKMLRTYYMDAPLGRHSGFRHVPGETGTTCKKAVFMLLFPREIQGIKWENGNFLSEVT